jgi:hypothetical protein
LTRLQAAAAAIAVLLLADLAAWTILPRPVTLKVPGELADVIPELQRFVERARGLRFYKQIDIRQSNDLGAIRTGLQAGGQSDADAAANQAAVLLALGLVDQSYDPKAATQTLSDEILGVYDPAKRRLLVRPGPVTPRMRLTLVHELTHALDGEHHKLFNRTRRVIADESSTSFRALAEGNANWVEHQYQATLTDADRAALEAARRPPPTHIPDVLLTLASYPYAAGEQFVQTLAGEDGVDAIDRAFEDPPVSSEQVLHVDRYLNNDEPKNVTKPLPGGQVVQRGVFGELLLRLVVSKVAGIEAARTAGTGWGGGRYVAWREGAQVCVRATLVMDTAADTEELVGALRQWAAGKPNATVEAEPGVPVAFANCAGR